MRQKREAKTPRSGHDPELSSPSLLDFPKLTALLTPWPTPDHRYAQTRHAEDEAQPTCQRYRWSRYQDRVKAHRIIRGFMALRDQIHVPISIQIDRGQPF